MQGNRIPPPLESLKLSSSLEDESKEGSQNAYSVALAGAAATGDGSFALSGGEKANSE